VAIVDPIGRESDDLLAWLEMTWGQRAVTPPHDKPNDAWRIGASVLMFASTACALGGCTAGDWRLWIASGATATLAGLAALGHRRRRSFGSKRRTT